MSLTPTTFFRGESVCACCDKPMYANDIGVVYNPYKKRNDIMFCINCAVKVTMSMAQDISRLNPDLSLSYYFEFKTQEFSAFNLRRHANALKELASKMEDYAGSVATMPHPNEDK